MIVPLKLFLLRQRLRQHDSWTRLQLERYQQRALKDLRSYAYKHSPFYQRFHSGHFDQPLHKLPVLTKEQLMEHFDELVTDRAIRLKDVEAHGAAMRWHERFLGRYWLLSTSGSTGLRGLFLFSQDEWLSILASYARATRDWTHLSPGWCEFIRAAGVSSATPWHISARVNASLRSRRFPTLVLDAGEPVETLVERLNDWQPALLMGYPSAISILAEEQIAKKLQIAPKTIITSSEVMTDSMRQRIQRAWGDRIFNEYGTTEGACLAAECDRHTGLHLFEDLVIVEVVDAANQPVPPGVYGDKILLTVLFSRTQPLIRYELNDRVRLTPSPCPCGRPFATLDAIDGRTSEVLYLPRLAGGMQAVLPATFLNVMELLPCSAWQVIQEPDGLRVLMSRASKDLTDESVIDMLRRAMDNLHLAVRSITVQRVDAIPRGATGKAPLILSMPPC